ncbi:hypothetical protein NPIL_321791 [Nephila pilipes]|uniref:Spider venom protein n=1 Tax=Nephila pilipes TaxID=299642 RepID=A0A8X6NNN3_NEPPI|nr:hypothetical protein NPIL_321791 [Nephila pilipes]
MLHDSHLKEILHLIILALYHAPQTALPCESNMDSQTGMCRISIFRQKSLRHLACNTLMLLKKISKLETHLNVDLSIFYPCHDIFENYSVIIHPGTC